MKPIPLSRLLDTAKQALLAGGAIVKHGYTVKRRIRYKEPTSPVTQIDLASEKKIIQTIRRRFPDHTFLAEESAFVKKGDLGKSRPDRYRWVIDPLDGTVNFMHGIPLACVSIAVERGGTVLAGGIYDPSHDELFLAAKGQGSTLNGRRIRVSPEKDLGRALLITGFPYDHRDHSNFYMKYVHAFLKKGQDLRRLGSAAIDLAWVACGRAEGFWELKLNPWDVAAGWLLVEEAGGRVSNFRNQRVTIDDTTQTLATNGHIHEAMARVMKGIGGGGRGVKS